MGRDWAVNDRTEGGFRGPGPSVVALETRPKVYEMEVDEQDQPRRAE